MSCHWTVLVLVAVFLITIDAATDDPGWDLCTDTPPADLKLWTSISNGHVATIVHSDSVYMNGLYNGNGTTSTRGRLPAMTSLEVLNLTSYSNMKTSFCLHIKTGIYEEVYTSDHFRVTVTMYAHREITRLLVTEISIATDGLQGSLRIPLKVNKGNDSDSVTLTSGQSDITTARYMYGRTNEAETPESGRTPVYIYYSQVPTDVTIDAGHVGTEKLVFLMAVSPDQAEARLAYNTGLKMHLNDTLRSSHAAKWEMTWQKGRVDVQGNVTLASTVYSALYYIISAMPLEPDMTWPFVGLSPADLAHNGYNGHLFWDQDTWMYPPVLLLHVDLGAILVNTRLRTLNGSREFARRNGYQGAQYAWESAFTGLDVTPWPPAQDYEIHVTGDVALALRQYMEVTGDNVMLHEPLFRETVFAIADFWKSRVTLDSSRGLYEIHNVMPPDEWHYPVNNSIYTNYVAKMALQLPRALCDVISCHAPASYENVADKMYLLFDAVNQYHPEYDTYTLNETVKQGDVILLGYPLQMPMNVTVRRNDLEIYANRTGEGPAMTWGMFAIGWLDLGETARAARLFWQQLDNRYGPFNTWTEQADGTGVTNFITGQGGYLQSIINGYLGVRILSDRLAAYCRPLPGSTGVSAVGIDYLGNSLDLFCNSFVTTVTVTSQGRPLYMHMSNPPRVVSLQLRVPVDIRNQPISLSQRDSNVPVGNVPVVIVG